MKQDNISAKIATHQNLHMWQFCISRPLIHLANGLRKIIICKCSFAKYLLRSKVNQLVLKQQQKKSTNLHVYTTMRDTLAS